MSVGLPLALVLCSGELIRARRLGVSVRTGGCWRTSTDAHTVLSPWRKNANENDRCQGLKYNRACFNIGTLLTRNNGGITGSPKKYLETCN